MSHDDDSFWGDEDEPFWEDDTPSSPRRPEAYAPTPHWSDLDDAGQAGADAHERRLMDAADPAHASEPMAYPSPTWDDPATPEHEAQEHYQRRNAERQFADSAHTGTSNLDDAARERAQRGIDTVLTSAQAREREQAETARRIFTTPEPADGEDVLFELAEPEDAEGAPRPPAPEHTDSANPAPQPDFANSAPPPFSPPPPTPPKSPGRRPGEARSSDGVRYWAHLLWTRGPGRLEPVAWWGARVVWRHPLRWAVLVTLVVTLTPVSVGHMVALVLTGVVLASGPGEGATNRRERFVSLRGVGAYRKRARRVKQRWQQMWANAGLVRAALNTGGAKRLPVLKGMRPHRDGVTAFVSGEHVAVGVEEVLNAAHALAETTGALSVRVTKPQAGGKKKPSTTTNLTGSSSGLGLLSSLGARREAARARGPWRDRGHLLSITFKFQDPFPKRPIKLSELPPPSGPGKVVIGLDEEHRGLEKSLFLPSLIVGAPGSGKSTEVWTTLRALREAAIPFRLRVFDPKGGLELGDLKDAAFRYESVPSRWPIFLQQACEALKVRQEMMAKKSRNKGVQVRKIITPDEEFPLDLMLIDELVTMLAMSKGQDAKVRVFGQEMSAKEAFVVYLSQIRATLGSCIALSQLGEKQVIGPARGMFTYVSCLRVGQTEKELVDILLGSGAHNAYPAHLLDASDPNMAGRGWVHTSEGVIAYRAAFMDDAERAAEAREIGKATAKYRARGQRDPEVEEAVRRPRGRSAGTGGPRAKTSTKPAPKTTAVKD